MTKPLSSLVGLLLLTTPPVFSQSLDPAFTTSRIYKPGTVFSTLEQPDGQRIVAGRFVRANGTAVSNLTRLSAGGVPDAVFQRNLGSDAAGMYRPRLLPNGQLLVIAIGAAPIRAGGLSRASVLRLNADGTGDAAFSAGTGATRNGTPVFVDDLLALPNGKLIVVGPFDQFDGTPANRIVRLTANGAVDPTFQSGTGANNEIETITIQPDGLLLIGGTSTATMATRPTGWPASTPTAASTAPSARRSRRTAKPSICWCSPTAKFWPPAVCTLPRRGWVMAAAWYACCPTAPSTAALMPFWTITRRTPILVTPCSYSPTAEF